MGIPAPSALLFLIPLAAALSSVTATGSRAGTISEYHGTCDASAAVPLGRNHFVIGNDEDNVLRIYRFGTPRPVAEVALDDFARPETAYPEMDIEAAAMLGNRIYWIGSHGASGKGKPRESRHRLIATEVRPGAVPKVVPVGKPYSRLLDDLAAAPQLRRYRLERAARIAPKATGGLNIEGLAATPAGTLLVGLRNPQPHGRALVIEISNPAAVVEGKAPARIGAVTEIDFGGRGIRAMMREETGYLIATGSRADGGDYPLFRWSGRTGDAARELGHPLPAGLQPEALMNVPGRGTYLISDDGIRMIGGLECKSLAPKDRKFRTLPVAP